MPVDNTTVRNRHTATTINFADTKAADPRIAQLEAWDVEAREWIRLNALELIRARAPKPVGVAAVMGHLDSLPGPAGYEIMARDYARRYHMVRRTMLLMAKAGELATTSALNSRKRASVNFTQPMPPVLETIVKVPSRRRQARSTASQYDILIEGQPELRESFERWFAENVGDAANVSILAVKK